MSRNVPNNNIPNNNSSLLMSVTTDWNNLINRFIDQQKSKNRDYNEYEFNHQFFEVRDPHLAIDIH